MKNYLFYQQDGTAVMCCTVQDEADPTSLSDLSYVEVPDHVSTSHYWVNSNGEVTPYSAVGISRRENPPPYPATWNPVTEDWDDVRNLDQLRDAKWKEIKAARDAVEFGPFTYNGMEFDGDVDAQRRLNGYISISKSALATGQSFSAQFILANDTVVTLQANDFVQIEIAKVTQVAAAFEKAALLRVHIEAASSKAAIEAIAW